MAALCRLQLDGAHFQARKFWPNLRIRRILTAFTPSPGRTPCRNAAMRPVPAAALSSRAQASSAPPPRCAAGRRRRHAGCAAGEIEGRLPGPLQIAAETMPPAKDPVNQTSSGGDFMVDVLKSLDIDYLAINCASSFRGLHEAVINSRRQHQAGNHHLPARRNRGRTWRRATPRSKASRSPWLPRRRRPAACHHGDVQRLVRPRAGHRASAATSWRPTSAARRRMAAFRRRHRRDRPRLHQMGRSAGLAAAFRRVGGARLQDRDDAADGAGVSRRSTPSCRRIRFPIARGLRIPKLAQVMPPQGDSGAIAERRTCWSRPRTRSSSAIAWRARRPAWRAWSSLPRRCNAPSSINAGRMNFPSRHPLNQTFRRGAVIAAGRRHPGDRDERSMGRAQRLQRPHRAPLAPGSQSRARRSSRSACRDLYLKSNYQDFGRYAGRRSRHRGRRRSLAAGADRGGESGSSTAAASPPSRRAARNSPRASRHGRASRRPTRPSAGTRARSPPRGCAPRSMPRSRTRTGRWSAPAIRLTWPHRLWNFNKPYQWNGGSGGAGVGYNAAGLAWCGARQQEARPLHASHSAATAT